MVLYNNSLGGREYRRNYYIINGRTIFWKKKKLAKLGWVSELSPGGGSGPIPLLGNNERGGGTQGVFASHIKIKGWAEVFLLYIPERVSWG